jgi:hypothetical protein
MTPFGTHRQRAWLKATPHQRTKLAEKLGDIGARAYAKANKWTVISNGTARKLSIGPDQTYRDSHGIIHVIEAKGGSGQLGHAYGHAQGSITWAIASARQVLRHAHATAAERQGAVAILQAATKGKLHIHVIRTTHVLGEPITTILEQTVSNQKAPSIMKTIWTIAIAFCIICGITIFAFGANKFRWFVAGQAVSVKNDVWDAVSLDAKLNMADVAFKELQPLAIKYTKQIVLAESAVEKIKTRIKEYEAGMEYSQNKIVKEKEDFKAATAAGQTKMTYDNVEYTLTEVEKDIAQKFAAYESNETILKDLRQTLVSRQATLDNYHTALGNAEETSGKLGSKIALLRARLETVKTAPDTIINDTTGELQTLLVDIDANITAAERVSKMGIDNFNKGIPIPDPQATDDMLKKIDEKFKR